MKTTQLINKTKFKHWLAGQPDYRTFDFMDNRRCLFASFLNETNPGEVFGCGSHTFNHWSANWATHKFPQWAIDISRVLGISLDKPSTTFRRRQPSEIRPL